ncbi:MAG: hypothetical protein FWD62_13155 [Betaproteobacteria bacterium]|nr:hypothetical protein [Betaproteobacteria bacterium]
MTPEERFRLNAGAKEHRLQKMRERLEAATPTQRKIHRRRSGWGGFWFIVAVIVIGWFGRRIGLV